MARARWARRAVLAAVVGLGAIGSAWGRESCSLLLMAPDRSDERIVDTVPPGQSVCYALGVEPGRLVRLALVQGADTVFGVAGIAQDARFAEFTSGAGVHEIRLSRVAGSVSTQAFALTIHVEPAPEPVAGVARPAFPPPNRRDPAAAGEAVAALPAPAQGGAASAATPDAPAGALAGLEPASTAPRSFGPGWTLDVDAARGLVAVRGTASDERTVFAGRCGLGLPPGLSVTLTGVTPAALPRGATAPVSFDITSADQSVARFPSALAFDPASQAWTTTAPLPAGFRAPYGSGVLLKVVRPDGATVATFLLYDTAAAASAMAEHCTAPAVAAAQPLAPPQPPSQPDPVPAVPVVAVAPGWTLLPDAGPSGAAVQGVAVDGKATLEARCGPGLAPGVHLLLRGSGLAAGALRVTVTDAGGQPQSFNTVLGPVLGGAAWASQLPLPAAFAYAFAQGGTLSVGPSGGGAAAATFALDGAEPARNAMRRACGL
ncbi:MAG: hypothetical protein R3F55_10045 [Alphaproteobacteria bacterium]